jgi:hypothetical protein
MKASRFSPLSRGSSVQVRSEIVWWSRRYSAFSASGSDFHSGAFFVFIGFSAAASASGSVSSAGSPVASTVATTVGISLPAVPGQDIVAADPFLAGFPDPLEIPLVRTANP